MAVIYVVVIAEPGEPDFTWLIASDFTSALPPGSEAPPPFIYLLFSLPASLEDG